ncbi:MAG: glycosyltransferase, partial [Candidatus Limnocylindrales bacterium]
MAEKEAAGSWIGEWPILYLPNPVDSKKYTSSAKRHDKPRLLYSPDAVDPGIYVSLNEDRRLFREKWGIPETSPVVICAARPDWKKRVDLLIGALARTKEWHLVFAGEHASGKGPEWKQYAEALGVTERVH